MNDNTVEQVEEEDSWVLIPMTSENVIEFYRWIGRFSQTNDDDKNIANKCETLLIDTFEKHGLNYNEDRYGEIKMDNIRLFLGSNGVALPVKCFKTMKDSCKRIKNPLQQII